MQNYFILIAVPTTWQAIQSRFTRSTKDSTISDIYDGIAYTLHSQQPGGFLSREYPANLSFTLSTDGVKVFKSSISEVWPVWLVVNELPPCMRSAWFCMKCKVSMFLKSKYRYSKKHVMLAGLWFSKDKPTMSTYLMPLLNKFNVLHDTGGHCNITIYFPRLNCAWVNCRNTSKHSCWNNGFKVHNFDVYSRFASKS